MDRTVAEGHWATEPENGETRSKHEVAIDKWLDRTAYAAQYYQMLLTHESFYGVNCADVDGVRRLVQDLVKLDRLPKELIPETGVL